MEDVTATSWNDLQDKLMEGSWNPQLGLFRSPFAFRGVCRADHPLQTGLSRLGGDFAAMERHLLRNFRKYAHRDVVETDSVWHWISLGQHHGLPTRLLDWTYSPLVALHFVTADPGAMDADGAIWSVRFGAVHAHAPAPLREALEAVGADVFTVEMLARAAPTLAELASLAPDPFPIFFEPPSLDARIVNQYALFSVMSTPEASLPDWLAERPGLARRVIIPAALKWEARDRLDQFNITERVLFPGLDGLSAWLRRQYRPRR